MRAKVPGVYIPDEVIARLRGAPKGKQREEGKRICVEIIQQVRELSLIHIFRQSVSKTGQINALNHQYRLASQ